MWFKVENKRSSIGQRFVVRCNSELAGAHCRGAARKRHHGGAQDGWDFSSTLNVTATVYGTDSEGEFVYGVYEVSDGAAAASSPLIKRLFAESAAASLAFKDQLLADIPEDTIKGFASMSAALGYIVAQHKQIKRAAAPQISYSTLFRIFCGASDPSTLTLPVTTPPSRSSREDWSTCPIGCGSANCRVLVMQTAAPYCQACARTK